MMTIWRTVAGCLTLLMIAVAGFAQAAETTPPRRLALVIANSAYASLPSLPNAARDGEAIAKALTAAKFMDASGQGAVRTRANLTDAQLKAELEAFRGELAKAGENAFGLVYYSGHGFTLGSYGDGALLPVDQGSEVQPGLVTRAMITDRLLGAGARTVVVVLDMCRSALDGAAAPPSGAVPVRGAGGVSPGDGTKGLVRYAPSQRRPDQGYLVAYSTSADQVAFDNGVFSRVLAEEIRRPGQNVADVFKRVSDRVAVGSGGGRTWQKPTFDYGLQGDPPCFVSCDPQADGNRFYDCANCPYMRIIPAGEATLGSPADEAGRDKDEPGAHSARIARPFALSVFEVTLSEWAACELDGACRKRPNWSKDNPNPLIPATHLSYRDAAGYVAWLSARSGRKYRLPTEEEWEYAARAGASTAFQFGDEISPSLANYDHTARYKGSPVAPYRGYPEAVTGYPANPFGLVQMEGNVWEWTGACLSGAGADCKNRVLRGGSFSSAPGELRLANRFAIADEKVRDDVGLRVARDVDPDEQRR